MTEKLNSKVETEEAIYIKSLHSHLREKFSKGIFNFIDCVVIILIH